MRLHSPAAPSAAQAAAGAFVLRVSLGTVFVAHAYAKAFVYTFAGTARFFSAHGFPGWTAYPVFLAELLGGVALLAGVRTRPVALALIPVMLGALSVHLPRGWMFDGAGGGWEYPAFLVLALGAQALLGDGAWALRPASGLRTARASEGERP